MKTKITVDNNQIVGKIKPMHCVNNLADIRDAVQKERGEAGIPYSRLHDTAFINPHLVDIHAVFPNFDADENDPESYDFAFTDFLLKRMNDMGVRPFYRLGESIENFHNIKAYHIFPPKNFEKWARICGNVIAHYNEGWANGFHYDIEYWEIWNEPDNFPDNSENAMWQGTPEQYFELYEITSNYLKNKFPHLKIGGYASCGFYAIINEPAAPQANISPRTENYLVFLRNFLEYITSPEHRSPLDFFSWHSYSSVDSNIRYAEYARQKLDEFGLFETENHLNEWNPGIQYRGTLRDASNICANILAMQNTSLDMMMYYDARLNTPYCGLFDSVNIKPFPAYYIFKAFNELYTLEKQADVKIDGDADIYALCAFDGEQGALLITNNSESKQILELGGIKNIKEILSVNEISFLENIDFVNNTHQIAPFESLLIRYQKN